MLGAVEAGAGALLCVAAGVALARPPRWRWAVVTGARGGRFNVLFSCLLYFGVFAIHDATRTRGRWWSIGIALSAGLLLMALSALVLRRARNQPARGDGTHRGHRPRASSVAPTCAPNPGRDHATTQETLED